MADADNRNGDAEEKPNLSNENVLGDFSPGIQRVSLVSSSPSARSIVRVMFIVLLFLALRDFLGNVLSALTHLFFMIVLAVFVAYLINPLTRLVRRPFETESRAKFMPRSLAIAISFLIVFAVLGMGIMALAPSISSQARDFATNVPTYTTSIQTTLNDFNRRLDRMRVSESVQTDINERINQSLSAAGTYVTNLIGSTALTLISYLPWLVLVPILAFFFLKDAALFRVALLRMVPVGDWRTRVEAVMRDVNKTLAAYTRAQLIACLLIGVICTIGFYLLGNNYAILLGIVAGVLEFIPLIGPLTVAILATLVAGLESGWQAFWTAVFLGLLRIVQDYYFYPRIIREGIHLHPLAVILSVLAGEQVAGIAGVFLSIPIVALVTVIYKHVLEHSGSSGLFTGLLEPKENKEVAQSS
jgi:predicted PurR-regulated permease PerM